MPIISSNIVEYAAANMTQGNGGGGVMNKASPIPDNVLAALFDDITEEERTSGASRHAKTHWNVENSSNLTALGLLLYPLYPLAGDVVLSIRSGTHTDVWSDVSSARNYGCANVSSNTAITAGAANQIVVDTRGASYSHFQIGDTCVLTDKLSVDDTTGHLEILEISAVSISGDQATITFDSNIKYSYNAIRTISGKTVKTRLASCVGYGDVQVSFSVNNVTSASGTHTVAKLQPRNLGAITHTITITFDSSTAFSAISSVNGGLTGGSISSTYQPLDSNGNAYLSIPPAFWGGTWAPGDTLQIHVNPAAAPLWYVLDIPSGSAAQDVENIVIAGWCRTGSS